MNGYLNLDQVLGAVRAIVLCFTGVAISQAGFDQSSWDATQAFILGAVTLAWGVREHDATIDMLQSAVRSLLAAATGYAGHRGWISQQDALLYTSASLALVPLIWTWFAHRFPSSVAPSPQAVAKVILLAAFLGGAGFMLVAGTSTARAAPAPKASSILQWNGIQLWTVDDLTTAIAMAQNASPPDAPAAACMSKVLGYVQSSAAGLPITLHLATDFERLWLFHEEINALKEDTNCQAFCGRLPVLLPIIGKIAPNLCDAANLAR